METVALARTVFGVSRIEREESPKRSHPALIVIRTGPSIPTLPSYSQLSEDEWSEALPVLNSKAKGGCCGQSDPG